MKGTQLSPPVATAAAAQLVPSDYAVPRPFCALSLSVLLCLLEMEPAIKALISQFKTFAGKDGSCDTLSKEEFCSLVASQLPNFVPNGSDPCVADELMGSLDKNNDGQLTFVEFWQLIGTLALQQCGFHQ